MKVVCAVIDHRNDIPQSVQIYKPWKIGVDLLINRIFGNVSINQKLQTFNWKEAKKQFISLNPKITLRN